MGEELHVDSFTETTFEVVFERMAKAMEELGVAICEAFEPIWGHVVESIDCFWLAMKRAYLADRWHLGQLAWRLPDWIVRRVPLEWVVKWLYSEVE